MGKSSILKMEL